MPKHIFIRGNSKLGKDVLIFNLPPGNKKDGGTCTPTKWCQDNCYAKKGMHTYPSVTEANKARLEISKESEFADNAIAELQKTNKPMVRIHSSGDFYSEDYVNKWVEICKGMPDKKFLAFTKSTHLKTSLQKLARLPNVVLYESLDSSCEKPKTNFLRAMLDDCKLASERAAKKRIKETIKCTGDCVKCNHQCWNGDKHVVFHKH